jgi:predicted lipoprotein with Yx(FWY)xxD motif
VYWPPLVSNGKPIARAGAHANLLGTSRRRDGRMQVTYAGHPLCYFVQDTKPGQTKGEGLTGFRSPTEPAVSSSPRARPSASAASRPAAI